MKSKILGLVLLLSFFLAGVLAVSKVSAQSANTWNNPLSSLIERIAQKFGLKQAEVQKVFEEERTQRQWQREKNYLSRLDQLVAEGKITQEQKQLILDKNKEIRAKRQAEMKAWQNQTPEQREEKREQKRAEREKEREELKSWAEKNGIDLKYLLGGFNKGDFGKGWFGKGGGFKGDGDCNCQ